MKVTGMYVQEKKGNGDKHLHLHAGTATGLMHPPPVPKTIEEWEVQVRDARAARAKIQDQKLALEAVNIVEGEVVED